MASIQSTTSKTTGQITYRVGYMHDPGDGKGRRLRWTHRVPSPEAAVEMKGMFEKLGPELALATIAARIGRDVKKGAPLLRDRLATHLEALGAHCTPGTIADYRKMAARTWLDRLGPLPLDQITRDHVVAWVAWQRLQETERSSRAREKARVAGKKEPDVQTVSPKSIANAHGFLSSVLSAAVEAELIPRNVAHGVKLPDDDETPEMEIFTEEEWQAFYDAIDPYYRPLTLFLIATGVRIGEATAVQVRDLDLTGARPTVTLRRAWKKGAGNARQLGSTKSRRGNRTIVLPAELHADLKRLAWGRGAKEFLFVGPRGAVIHPNNFRERQWARAKAAARITKDVTPHSLRHTSASWLLGAGVAPQVVQHRLGHESLATTSKVYAHLLTDAQVAAADVTAGALRLGSLQIEA
jgi:integrase